jgi:predicted Zn-dependent protease
MFERTQRMIRVLLAVVMLMLAACATVPVTGRRQLSIVPAGEMLAMSYQQYNEVIQASELSRDAEATAMVRRVGLRMQRAVERYMQQKGLSNHLDGYRWEFNLIESEQVNAWCMPGGKVAFYTGILPICRDENGVAVVMGHEVAHAVAEHGRERVSQGLLAQMGGMALGEALKNKPEQTQTLWMTAFAVGAQFGAVLPYSRLHENEADHMGLIFMAMAGYDPREAPAFWERMSAQGGAKPPEFLSTHPSDATRIRNLHEKMPEALQYYEAAVP